MTLFDPKPLPLTATLVALALLCGCKPEAPDLHDQRRPAASERAEAAKAAIAAGSKTSASRIAGLTPEVAATVVATVGDRTITLGDVATYIAQLPRSARARYVVAEQQRELVKHLVEVELLAHEGEKRGFGADPVVQHTRKKALANELLRTVTTELSIGDITDAEVKAYYDANASEYVRPERRRAAVIYFNDREEAEAAAKALKEAIAATPKASKQIFGDWAKEKSIDTTTGTLKGDLGWFDAKGLNAKGQTRVAGRVLAATFGAKKVHDVSPPLELESRQWVMTQLTGIKPAAEAPMAEVRLDIQNALLTERRAKAKAAFIEDLRAKATISVDEAALAGLPTQAPAPPTTPTVPKLNPALFRRGTNPGIVKRPGPGGAKNALQLKRERGQLPQETIDAYLKKTKGDTPPGSGGP